MRKTIITITIIALIVSIVGTGVIVYLESSQLSDTEVSTTANP